MNYLGLIKNKAFLVHRRYVWAIKEKSVPCLKNISGLSFLHPETQSSHWVAISAEEKVAQLKEIKNCDFTYDCFKEPEGEDRKGFPSPSNSNTALIRLSRINKLLNSVLSSLLWMIFERINVIKKPIEWRMHSRTRSFLIVVNINSDSILLKLSSVIIFQKMAQLEYLADFLTKFRGPNTRCDRYQIL